MEDGVELAIENPDVRVVGGNAVDAFRADCRPEALIAARVVVDEHPLLPLMTTDVDPSLLAAAPCEPLLLLQAVVFNQTPSAAYSKVPSTSVSTTKNFVPTAVDCTFESRSKHGCPAVCHWRCR